jgi:hypothetical protein
VLVVERFSDGLYVFPFHVWGPLADCNAVRVTVFA